MTIESVLQTAAELLASWAKESAAPESNRLDLIIEPGDLRAAVQKLQDEHWGYLSTITGLDLGVEAGQLEMLYHFCSGAAVVTLRVRLPRENPVVPTIQNIIPSVSFYERELNEMMGVTFEGAPVEDRLFLPDDFPAGVYPLRKDFDPAMITGQ
jgi:NADH:ubiquinone oxidoreductase subunit C